MPFLRSFPSTALAAVIVLVAPAMSCTVQSRCSDHECRPPTAAPSKQAAAFPDARLAVEREDAHGVCNDADDYVGVCDESVSALAWYCVDERLFALDCSRLANPHECRETEAAWSCERASESFEDL